MFCCCANSLSNITFSLNPTLLSLYCCFTQPKILGSNGKYWTTDGGQVMCVGEQGEATGFQLELLGNSRIGIKTADGNYLRGENNGVLTASAPEVFFYLSFSYLWLR